MIKKYYLPTLTFILPLMLYSILAVKQYSWIFQSSDSGDWLASAQMLFVPQPFGYPLFVLLGQVLHLIFPNNLPFVMTFFLSCIPSSVTCLLLFFIIQKLVNTKLAVISSLTLVVSTIFLTQSTVLTTYALSTMLLTLAFYFYVNDRKYLTTITLALGLSVHILFIGIIAFWIIIESQRLRAWTKPFVVFVLIAIGFYSLIPLLMNLETPRFLAGSLSITNLLNYMFATSGAIVGQLSLYEAPKRLLETACMLLASFGVGWIAFFYGVRSPRSKFAFLALGIVVWSLWFYVTDLDPIAWHSSLTMMSPFVVLLIVSGLSRLKSIHTNLVVAFSLCLLIVNSIWMNASILDKQKPLASNYYQVLMNLPDKSVVVTLPGPYSLGSFYVYSSGKDIIPLTYPLSTDMKTWISQNYELDIDKDFDTVMTIAYLKYKNYEVYFASSPDKDNVLRQCFVLQEITPQVSKIIEFTGLEPKEELRK